MTPLELPKGEKRKKGLLRFKKSSKYHQQI